MKIAFDTWSAVTQLNFTEVPKNGNIKIDFVKKEHGDGYSFDGPGKMLAHSLLPPKGVIHFDIDERWVILISSELSRYDTVDLLQTAIHEIGHVLGLEHSWEKNSIMSPFYHQPIDENGEYQLSRQESEECISKQAYYDIENNHISVISMDFKCDELLVNAFKRAIIIPENLKIQIINNPQDYENILRTALDLCYITVIQDLSAVHITWFLFDCTKNGEMHKSKGGIKWVIIISLTVIAIIICASVGICCYFLSRKRNRKHSKEEQSLSKQYANRNTNNLSGESSDIKSYPSSMKKTLSGTAHRSPGKSSESTNSYHKKIKKVNRSGSPDTRWVDNSDEWNV